MAYNTKLETRIDAAVTRWKGVTRKKMFGGVCWLLKGNICFGIWKDSLIVRMDKERAEKSLSLRNVRTFDITGKPMTGWIMVDEAGWRSSSGLARWLEIGKDFAGTLPEKTKKPKKTKRLRDYRA